MLRRLLTRVSPALFDEPNLGGLIHPRSETGSLFTRGAAVIELPDRFWSKVEKTESCWLWTANQIHDGYGSFWLGGKMQLAHRVSYEALVGPIRKGLGLDHLCRVRHCVNPKHLEPVTNRENLMRGETLAAAQSLRTHCPQGHAYSLENTYVNRGKRYCRECKKRHKREWRERKGVA